MHTSFIRYLYTSRIYNIHRHTTPHAYTHTHTLQVSAIQWKYVSTFSNWPPHKQLVECTLEIPIRFFLDVCFLPAKMVAWFVAEWHLVVDNYLSL